MCVTFPLFPLIFGCKLTATVISARTVIINSLGTKAFWLQNSLKKGMERIDNSVSCNKENMEQVQTNGKSSIHKNLLSLK